MKRAIFSGWVLFCVIGLLSQANATLVLPRTLEQLAAKSYVVVWGSVDRVETDSRTGRRRAVLIPSENYLRAGGASSQKEFFVRLEGRMLPGPEKIVEMVAGAPQLEAREEVLIFLSPERKIDPKEISANTLFVPTGFHQGIYRIFKDKLGARRALSYREFSGSREGEKMRGADAEVAAAPLLADLITRIRDAQARSEEVEKK